MAEPRYVSIVMDNNDGFIVTAFEEPEDAQRAVARLNEIVYGCGPLADREEYDGSEECPYYVAGDGSLGGFSHRVYASFDEWTGGVEQSEVQQKWEELHGRG